MAHIPGQFCRGFTSSKVQALLLERVTRWIHFTTLSRPLYKRISSYPLIVRRRETPNVLSSVGLLHLRQYQEPLNNRNRPIFTSARSCTTGNSGPSQNVQPPHTNYRTIYKFRYMRYVRLVSRFKIYQTALLVVICLPLWQGYTNGSVPLYAVAYAGAGMTSACLLLGIYSYFATKLIGQLQLNEVTNEVRISTINFFGRRKNKTIHLDSITSVESDPWQAPEVMNLLYSKLEYTDGNDSIHKLFYSLRWSMLLDRQKFGLLSGSHLQRMD